MLIAALVHHAAHATTLMGATITTAGTVTSNVVQTKDWAPKNVSIQCNFVYGTSGGHRLCRSDYAPG
jgi:hypothetical protein